MCLIQMTVLDSTTPVSAEASKAPYPGSRAGTGVCIPDKASSWGSVLAGLPPAKSAIGERLG
jgi:hypothetical protein